MRFAIGGFNHETNAFSNVPTNIESFRKYTLLHGEEIFRKNRGIRSYVGGSIDEADALGVELAPIMYCVTNPSGLITTETYAYITDEILGGLQKAHEEAPLDGILLELHGAGHAESSTDPEGDLIEKVRALFGPGMPIGVVLDLHANVSPKMVKYSDILLGVKCYPHMDQYDQGRNIVRLLAGKVRGGYDVHEALVKLPLIIVPASGSTLKGRTQIIRYLFVTVVNILINYLGLKLFVEVFQWWPTISYVIISIICVTFSYLTNKYFSFRKNDTNHGLSSTHQK